MKKKIVSTLHMLVLILTLFSPLLFSWEYILIYFIAWYIHIGIFGRCILAIWEFGHDSYDTYLASLLMRLGLIKNGDALEWFSYWITPSLVVILAYVLQRYVEIFPYLG